MSFDPLVNPLGEMPGYPRWRTTPAGGGGTQRSLWCSTVDVNNWMLYFTVTAPLDPYTMNGVCWEFSVKPFERQQRLAVSPAIFGPGVATFGYSILDIQYESTGMRYFPGLGVVKEEAKPRDEHVDVGVTYSRGGYGPAGLTWDANDHDPSNPNGNVFIGEHPHMVIGGAEITLTFPFAPTGLEPFPSGGLTSSQPGQGYCNSDYFTMPVSGDTYAPGTLKYMGRASEPSVVIPAVGIYTGLVRYRKAFRLHYHPIGWNCRWRGATRRGTACKTSKAMNTTSTPESPFLRPIGSHDTRHPHAPVGRPDLADSPPVGGTGESSIRGTVCNGDGAGDLRQIAADVDSAGEHPLRAI